MMYNGLDSIVSRAWAVGFSDSGGTKVLREETVLRIVEQGTRTYKDWT